jgi:hypothetical protein
MSSRVLSVPRHLTLAEAARACTPQRDLKALVANGTGRKWCGSPAVSGSCSVTICSGWMARRTGRS